jgi:glutamyl-tRNA synthetase
MNGMYLRRAPDAELARLVEPYLIQAGLEVNRPTLVAILPYVRERLQTSLLDAVPLVDFLFKEPIVTPETFSSIPLSRGELVRILEAVRHAWDAAPAFDHATLEAELKTVIETLGANKKHVMMTIRLAATGRKATPPLFESVSVLGRRRALDRLARASEVLASGADEAPTIEST